MADYDPRDYGYESTFLGKGYYVKEKYLKEAGGNVWQPLQTISTSMIGSPGPFRTKEAALGWLEGFRNSLRITEGRRDNVKL